MTHEQTATVCAVEETMGQRIQRRRKALGLDVIDLAQAAGVDRGNLARIEADEVQRPRQSTIHAIESALNRLEGEMSGPYDAPPSTGQLIELRADGVKGSDFEIRSIIASGPIEDPDALAEAVAKLIERVRKPRNGHDG